MAQAHVTALAGVGPVSVEINSFDDTIVCADDQNDISSVDYMKVDDKVCLSTPIPHGVGPSLSRI